jgi:demethylmenaquinone methyltransferase/2-methoxy-6-polyprenyl-1,4-benzoquinol methylase
VLGVAGRGHVPTKPSDLVEYYSLRAAEYDGVYRKPERQENLAELHALLRRALAAHDVLEIACGTGYWTLSIAPAVRSVLATDASPEMLKFARSRSYPPGRVRFALADAQALVDLGATFTAGFAGFWWSHVPRKDLAGFLSSFHRCLGPAAKVVFIDNRYVKGSSTPISFIDGEGNTYQDRTLEDERRFRILNDFPSEEDLRTALVGKADDLEIALLKYYWCASYRALGEERGAAG